MSSRASSSTFRSSSQLVQLVQLDQAQGGICPDAFVDFFQLLQQFLLGTQRCLQFLGQGQLRRLLLGVGLQSRPKTELFDGPQCILHVLMLYHYM